MLKTTLSLAAVAAVSITPALALEVSKSAEIAAPPAKVWATIEKFCSIADWHPALEKCDLSEKGGKQVRTLTLKGGGSIVEEQTGHNDKKMDYSYKILTSPLPVEDYKSTITVMPSAGGSKVTWVGMFKAKGAPAAKAEEVIGGIYEAGFKGIADKVK